MGRASFHSFCDLQWRVAVFKCFPLPMFYIITIIFYIYNFIGVVSEMYNYCNVLCFISDGIWLLHSRGESADLLNHSLLLPLSAFESLKLLMFIILENTIALLIIDKMVKLNSEHANIPLVDELLYV